MSKRAPLTFDSPPIAPVVIVQEPENTQPIQHANMQTRKHAKAREGRIFIAAHVVEEAAKQFKHLTVQKRRTTQSMLVEAINDLFVKHGLSRIADE